MRARAAAPLIALAAVAVACGDDGPQLVVPVVGPSLPTPVAEVRAVDFAFEPRRTVVDVGAAVRFVNTGRNDHDVVPSAEEATWGVGTDGFGPGARYTAVFSEPGEYEYVCTLHLAQDMTGVIEVRE